MDPEKIANQLIPALKRRNLTPPFFPRDHMQNPLAEPNYLETEHDHL
jgi:hypothetical protein